MNNIKIRNVTENDLESVVDINIRGWKLAYKGIIDDGFLNNLNREDKLEKRKQDYKEGGFIVATVDEKVVGFCRYADEYDFSSEFSDVDCEIKALYVDMDLKNQGIGKALFNYVFKEFKNKNKKNMIIWCLEDNKKAIGFYKRMGGEIIAKKDIEIGNEKYKEIAFLYKITL